MTLQAGTRLGPYEILAPLGAGGMGEVYRAKDDRLGREVAIKVLPEAFSSDPLRLARFEKEARSASGLNHPNIVTIYDVGHADGITYIAMELVNGATLGELLAGGSLPIKKLMQIAPQVGEGLARAHEAGILHRDLKPENVMVTRDGLIKILDFGLAKPTPTMLGGPQDSERPTMTLVGVVVGTVGYMSPEQASGKPLDFRSDQFAFGLILYEMVTGKRAFQKETAVDTLAAIIRDEAPPIAASHPQTPAPLRWIIERCLAKEPRQRYSSSDDLARDLVSLRDHLSEASSGDAFATGERLPRLLAPGWRRHLRIPLVLGLLAAGALAGRVLWNAASSPPPLFHRLTFRRGSVSSARFAPDGQTIIYSAAWDGARKPQLYSVRVESPESQRLTLPEGQVESISSAGEMLVLNLLHFETGFASTGTLSQAPLSGSTPRELLEDVGDADWGPGKSLAVVRAPRWHYRLEFPVGKVLYETTGWISSPRVSPGGDSVAFFDHPVFGDDRGSVAMVDRSGKRKTLSSGWESEQGIAWSPSGKEIWFTATQAGSARGLFAVTTSGRQRAVATTPSGMKLQDIARDGRVLFIQDATRMGLLGLLTGETKERDLSGLDSSVEPYLSADANMTVFTEQSESGGSGYSVYLRKFDAPAPVRLGEGAAMALSPDGKWVLTCLVRTIPPQMMLLPTGPGEPRTLPKDTIDHWSGDFGAFFPDGKRIVFAGNEAGRPPRTFVQDIAGGAPHAITPEGVVARLLSPDGQSLVVRTAEQKFALAPLDGGPARTIPGLQPADKPLRWAADGRSLFVESTEKELTARVFRVDVATGRRDTWRELVPADPAGITLFESSAISADGKTILFSYVRELSELYSAQGLK